MSNSVRVAMVVVLLAAVGAVVAVKVYRGGPSPTPGPTATAAASRMPAATAPTRVAPTMAARPTPPPLTPAPRTALPRLVELGSDICQACKAMEPVINALRKDCAGSLEVVFVNVRTDPAAAEPYRIRLIPTQIFYGADGRELFRHEGFFGKDEILAKWKALGYDLGLVLK